MGCTEYNKSDILGTQERRGDKCDKLDGVSQRCYGFSLEGLEALSYPWTEDRLFSS